MRRFNPNWLKNRIMITDDYNMWKYVRIVKIVIVFLIYITIKHIYLKDLSPLFIPILVLSLLVLVPAFGICHEIQKVNQNNINSVLGLNCFHCAEIFPHKGIRIHRRELRKYKRRVRYFRKLIREALKTPLARERKLL